jgi:carboxyl-terminal processing protease
MKNGASWMNVARTLKVGIGGAILGMVLGCQIISPFPPSAKIPPEAEGQFRLMGEAWNTIQEVYVGRKTVDPQRATYGAIGGMVESLGDTGHSRFLTPKMVEQESNLNRGRLEGIGAEVQRKNNRLVIVAPMDDSPALKAGLKPGEIILKVNGEGVSGLPLESAVTKILGPPGTSVTLTLLIPDTGQSREVTIVRARINLQNVTWQPLPGTPSVQVRISSFSRGVTRDLRKVLRKVREERAGALILDLRNNPGGLLEEAVGTASQFLREGNVVLERDGAGRITPLPVKSGGLAYDLPMAVLVNEGTASAPEIVAGALQDYHRAGVVGEKTFGTGTVLGRFPLSDGSALLLAVREWLTPKGRAIWHLGITPDVAISLPPDVSPLFPRAGRKIPSEDWTDSRDLQLREALKFLSASGTMKIRS